MGKTEVEDVAFIGYDKLSDGKTDHIVHFFLDDYKFESLWKDPENHVDRLKRYKAVLSPQFSLYTKMPLALQVYNTFRNRWCGAFLQSKGVKVIPTVLWGETESFWFCFDGIQKGAVVAVSTIGWKKQKDLFLQGYYELIKRIDPTCILCYGDPFDEMKGNVISIDYSQTNNLTKWIKETGKPAQKSQLPTKFPC